MSFILDAIAKSEQERQRHEVPGPQVLALPVVSAPPPRSLLPYVVAGALLLNAAVLAAWMQSGQPPTESSPPSHSGDAGLVVPEAVRSVPVVSTRQTATPLAPAEATADESTAEVDVTVATIETTPSSRITMSAVTGEEVAGSKTEQETVQPEPATIMIDGEDTTAWIRIGPDTLSNKARNGQQAMPEQSVQGAGAAQRKVSRLSELPADVRNDLPKVVFSGHLYSSNPDSSMVFVGDGRPVAQGRQIEGELFLHEITPTGVIVEFRGYLIDVGVLQNWTLN